jgi:cation-transporting ATPase 13A2
MASSSRRSHDYTEGAAPIDIDNALAAQRRARRMSEHENFYGDGAVFDGPGQTPAVPSSISRMARTPGSASRRQSLAHDPRRPSLDHRRSGDSAHSLGAVSVASGVFSDDDAASGDEDEDRGRAHSAHRAGMFESISTFFGAGARPGLVRRGSRNTQRSRSRARSEYELGDGDDESVDDRWGYASGEEDSESDAGAPRADSPGALDYSSYPPSPDANLPMLPTDALFGDESRIDIGLPLEDDSPPPPGPPSRQNIYIADEDAHLRFFGYERIRWRAWAWTVGTVVTLGALGLLGHWFPRLWLRWVAHEHAFRDTKDGFVVIEVRWVVSRRSGAVLTQRTDGAPRRRDLPGQGAAVPVHALDRVQPAPDACPEHAFAPAERHVQGPIGRRGRAARDAARARLPLLALRA